MLVDTIEKVSQIKIEARGQQSEFRTRNPDLVKEVVDQLLGLCS